MTAFAALAQLGEELSATRSRLQVAGLIAAFLRSLDPPEIAPGARLIIGRVFAESDARVLNLSGSAVSRVVAQLLGERAAAAWQAGDGALDFGEAVQRVLAAAGHTALGEPLGLLDVYHTLEEIASALGPGSREAKEALLLGLLRRASPVEAKYIVKTLVREMRHGASEGMLLEGIARAAGAPAALVRKANQSAGDVGLVAELALAGGSAALAQGLPASIGRPLKPMLAQTAASVGEAFQMLGGALALEYKLDGARVQIHKQGPSVKLFSRHLSDLTPSLPDVAALAARSIRAEQAILEGEVIAVGAGGRPLPFQRLLQRLGRLRDIDAAMAEAPTRLYLFDALQVDGQLLLDAPYEERWAALEQVRGEIESAPRIIPRSVAEGEAFLAAARAAGHEGVMAKSLASAYTPGVRGATWLKIKPALTLDLVVVAADWGYGRRHGWLSNYHLAARDEDSGAFLVVGKTFKGLTDAEFRAITERLLGLEERRTRGTVYVRPAIVAEVAFNNIQKSPQYTSGMALRFARIVRWRDDKSPVEADSVQTMRKLYQTMEGDNP